MVAVYDTVRHEVYTCQDQEKGTQRRAIYPDDKREMAYALATALGSRYEVREL